MSAAQLIAYPSVALPAGLPAERLVGLSLPGVFLGAILAALLGMGLIVGVLRFAAPGDLDPAGVPVLTAIPSAARVLVVRLLLSRALAPVRRRGWRV